MWFWLLCWEDCQHMLSLLISDRPWEILQANRSPAIRQILRARLPSRVPIKEIFKGVYHLLASSRQTFKEFLSRGKKTETTTRRTALVVSNREIFMLRLVYLWIRRPNFNS